MWEERKEKSWTLLNSWTGYKTLWKMKKNTPSHLGLTFPKQALVFMCLQYKSFENTAGKGDIACNKQLLLFPQCFLTMRKTLCHFHQILNCRLQTLSLEESKILLFWKGLKQPNCRHTRH